MFKNGILYGVDYLVNRMGIVNCADEFAGTLPTSFEKDPLKNYHLTYDHENSIFVGLNEIFKKSKENNTNPVIECDKIADEKSEIIHPLYGHRSKLILDTLIKQY